MSLEQVFILGKFIGLLAILLQAIALFMSSRLDLGDLSIKVAEEKLPGNMLIDFYNAAKFGVARSLTTEEIKLKALQYSNSAEGNRRIFKSVLILIGISLVFQLVAVMVDIYLA